MKIIVSILRYFIVLITTLSISSCEYESLHHNIKISFEADNEEYTVNFTSETNFEGNFFWDFGDGNTSEQANPKHDYAASGEYVVSLTFSIKEASVKETKTISIKGIELEDIDGNRYQTAQCAGRIWMAENLRTTRCKDGSSIEILDLGSGSVQRKGMFWHDNSSSCSNSQLHGPVYNRYTLTNCNVCPECWHIPSFDEWQVLIRNWQNEDRPGAEGLKYAAYQMRVRGNDYWSNNNKATNSSGFSALPGGWLDSRSTTYAFFGNRAGYWLRDDNTSRVLKIASGDDGTWLDLASNTECFYVRCVKDIE